MDSALVPIKQGMEIGMNRLGVPRRHNDLVFYRSTGNEYLGASEVSFQDLLTSECFDTI